MDNQNYQNFCDNQIRNINSNGLGETQTNNNPKIKRIRKTFKRKIRKTFSKTTKPKNIKRKRKRKKSKKNNIIINLYNVSYRQDDHCDLKEISNIANTKINIRRKKFEDIYLATKDCTRTRARARKRKPKQKLEVLYPKKRKFFGKWIHSDKYELDIDKSKNSLLKKYPEILEKISYFSNNAPKFLSHAFMFVKNEVSTFGQKIINQSIINSEQYQLNRLDYEKFTKILSKEFNDRNMCKKLEDLFIEFQAKNERNLEKHNKKVIRYIRNNAIKELFANEYLDLTFYELFNLFIVYRLDDYIKEIKIEFDSEIKKKQNNADKNFIKKKTDSFADIIKFICERYEEYFDLIDERKKPVNLEKK
jgi:hypothetical protein